VHKASSSSSSSSWRLKPGAWSLLLLLVSAGCSSASRTEGLDSSKLPENVQGDYSIFARRCSKCHSISRPLTAGITDDEQWVNYVNRMRRQPGSGISLDDQEHILRFLRYYAADLRRKDAEKKAVQAPAAPAVVVDAAAPVPVVDPPKGDGQ